MSNGPYKRIGKRKKMGLQEVFTATALLVAFGIFTVPVHAEPQLSVPTGTPHVVSFPFEKINKNPYNIPYRYRNRKRNDNYIIQLLDNADYLYYANISIGTPPQKIRLHMDTGSSDMWVESVESTFCQDESNPCAITGMYDRKKSSTYEFLNNDFKISYADKEFSKGVYAKETFEIGEIKIRGLQFGVGLETTSSEGIMGIGYNTNEVQVDWLNRAPYPNLVDLMVKQGHIKSRAYSLWLNDMDAKTGEILFGGIDTAKFKGKLHTLPINVRKGKKGPSDFMITLTGLGLTNDQGEQMRLEGSNFGIPVLLDSGTTYTYLPEDLYQRLANEVGVRYMSGTSVVKCNLKRYNGSVDFDFSGYQINIPINEMVVDAYDIYGEPILFDNGEQLCFFGILPEENKDRAFVLGDTFLRSAYVVYDLDNAEISLANVHFNVTDSNILEIGSGKNAVPDAIGVEHPVTMEFDGTRIPHSRSGGSTQQGEPQVTDSPDENVAASLFKPYVGTVIGAWICLWSFLA